MPFDFGLQFLSHRTATAICVCLVAHDRQRVDSVPVNHDVQSTQVCWFEPHHFVIQSAIPFGATLDLVVQIVNHFGKRNVIGQHGAVGTKDLVRTLNPTSFLAKFHDSADVIIRHNDAATNDRLPEFFDVARIGNVLRLVNRDCVAAFVDDLVRHVGCGLNKINVGFALKSLLDDLHVQQAQESTTKPKTQRVAGFWFELKTWIVDGQTF